MKLWLWGISRGLRGTYTMKKKSKSTVDKNSKYRNNEHSGLHPGIVELVMLLARIAAEEDYEIMVQNKESKE